MATADVGHGWPTIFDGCKPLKMKKSGNRIFRFRVVNAHGRALYDTLISSKGTNTMKPGQTGFTLIELMIVVTIIGIMATMALPTYHDRIIRSQVEEALKLSDIARTAITDYYQQQRTFPASNEVARIPEPDKLIGNYVTEIRITDGAIHIRLGNKINAHVAGRMVTLRPAVVSGSPQSPISWLCGNDQPVSGMEGVSVSRTNIPERYLPLSCRNWGS